MTVVERMPDDPHGRYRYVIVDVTDGQLGDVILKNAEGNWRPGRVSGSGDPISLGSLTDVDTGGSAAGHVLGTDDGSSWGPVTIEHPSQPHQVGAAPAEHDHAIGDITGLQAALDSKASAGALAAVDAALDEEVDRVDGLVPRIAALEGRPIPDTPDDIGAAPASHTHGIGDVSGLNDAVTLIGNRLNALEGTPVPPIRKAVITLPAIALLANVEVDVTWSAPMPSANYVVTFSPELPTAHLGKLNAALKMGSTTAAKVTVVLSTALALTAGQGKLHLVAVG